MPTYRVTSRPEGDPTFVDDFGNTRPFMRQTVVAADSKAKARTIIEQINAEYVTGPNASGDRQVYRIVSVVLDV